MNLIKSFHVKDDFNTKKVRLKPCTVFFDVPKCTIFQYQKGAIKTSAWRRVRLSSEGEFQYQKGAIKTQED